MIDTILVIDDEPANIHLIKGILPPEIKLKAATSGAVALKQLEKSQPDLILLDLIMPNMDGFETLAKIKAMTSCSEIPVVIISGNASNEDIERTSTLGAKAHLQKPICKNELMRVITSL